MIAPYVEGDVLDLGCGNANVLRTYAPSIRHYCGVERSAERVSRLQLEFPTATFVQRNLDREALDVDRTFDCVLMIALTEHLFNQQFVFDGIARSLKPEGVIVITTPTPFGNDVVHRLGAFIGLFAKSAVDDHIVLYNRHRFSILAKEVDLVVKDHRYFQFGCNQIAILQKPIRH